MMPRDIPPSKSYQHLLTLTELEELVEPMDAAELEADLKKKKVRDTMKPFKAAVNNLVASAQKGNKSLQDGIRSVT